MFILQLKQDHPDLAETEALALIPGKNIVRAGELILIDGKAPDWNRLALTRKADELLFSCKTTELEKQIELFDWNATISGSYRVDLHHTDALPKTIANLVWKNLKEPHVDLTHPTTTLDFFFVDKTVFVGKRLWTNTERFEERLSGKLPAKHPSGMHPKLARAIVNLTGVPGTGKLVDPFCGAGGFLIEAMRMGLRVDGSDLDEGQVERANINLKPYGITVVQRDALTLRDPIDYLASDLPYGRNTKAKDTDALYRAFLVLLGKLLRKRAVLVFPDFADYRRLVVGSGLSIVATYPLYAHRSLTRNVVVVEPVEKK